MILKLKVRLVMKRLLIIFLLCVFNCLLVTKITACCYKKPIAVKPFDPQGDLRSIQLKMPSNEVLEFRTDSRATNLSLRTCIISLFGLDLDARNPRIQVTLNDASCVVYLDANYQQVSQALFYMNGPLSVGITHPIE